MSARLFSRLLALTVAAGLLSAPGTASAKAAEPESTAPSLAQRHEQQLAAIDSGFASGALTFGEAKLLFAEQAAIREAWIQATHHTPATADARFTFLLQTADRTHSRLAHNSAVQVTIRPITVAAW